MTAPSTTTEGGRRHQETVDEEEAPFTSPTLDVLTLNVGNPNRERAEQQVNWLAGRPETVLILTDIAHSSGCDLIASRFTAAEYDVTYPRPERGERGVMIVSRLITQPGPTWVRYLAHRAVSVSVQTDMGPLEIIGLSVPSREARETSTARKRDFLAACRAGLPLGCMGRRLIMGDFNVLEANHVPRYRHFQAFEYGFYSWLSTVAYRDAFRMLHPRAPEYSWVGSDGNGYRYDHAHMSAKLATALRSCDYVHEPRTGVRRMTDRSALSLSLALRPIETLPLSVPARAVHAVPALP
ncbi:endonuclease/exonuclease/phosphatase [Streptomyces milbemycinicus]|uniref:endonuclease/exonuclease/phosphatase n=1 Tax=Streptomyces milbemycinicus TaxID=476552 RepID=UPI00340DFC30